MTTISAELNSLLKSMEYPAHRSDLVREAAREGVRDAEYQRLTRITPRSYSGRFDVLRELALGRMTAPTTSLAPVGAVA
jgi:hypothetical protein